MYGGRDDGGGGGGDGGAVWDAGLVMSERASERERERERERARARARDSIRVERIEFVRIFSEVGPFRVFVAACNGSSHSNECGQTMKPTGRQMDEEMEAMFEPIVDEEGGDGDTGGLDTDGMDMDGEVCLSNPLWHFLCTRLIAICVVGFAKEAVCMTCFSASNLRIVSDRGWPLGYDPLYYLHYSKFKLSQRISRCN